MITKEDIAYYPGVIDSFDGAFLTGSFLVDKNKANDIDIVVPLLAWKLWVARDGDCSRETACVSGIEFERQETEGSDDYGNDDQEMYELSDHWRGGGINILVINDMFIPAYKAAAYRLECNPSAFRDRDSRVEIHQRMKQIIRDMLQEAANSGDDIPW